MDHQAFKIRNKETKEDSIFDTLFIKHKYLTHPTVKPADAVVKSLNDLEKAFQGHLPQNESQMEDLEHTTDVLIMKTERTTTTGAIPTAIEYPRVQMETPGPRATNCPPRVQNIPTTAPALVVEHPQAN